MSIKSAPHHSPVPVYKNALCYRQNACAGCGCQRQHFPDKVKNRSPFGNLSAVISVVFCYQSSTGAVFFLRVASLSITSFKRATSNKSFRPAHAK